MIWVARADVECEPGHCFDDARSARPRQVSGSPQTLLGVWGANANNVWAVGAGDTIVKWNGMAWAVQTSGTKQALYGVWGTDINNVRAAGGEILKWNRNAWATQTSNATVLIYGVWGTDAKNTWAVGTSATILHQTE